MSPSAAAPIPVDEAESPRPHREAFWHWKPTSGAQAERAERDMLVALTVPYTQSKVRVNAEVEINTLKAGSGPPLVLLHGMAAALGLWVPNIPTLARHYTVYAIDMPGFGRSSRAPFHGDTVQDGEAYFTTAIDGWRAAMGLDRVTLLGHSMGGYLSAVYALTHPRHVSHLILADPWGIPPRGEPKRKFPWYAKIIFRIATQFNPLALVRVSGPWGPDLVVRLRSDIARKFDGLYSDPNLVLDYIYHSNAAEPTGESAFSAMSDGLAWAKDPLHTRLPALDPKIFVSFIYGANTWMDTAAGQAAAEALAPRATYRIIPNAGHQVTFDNPKMFNAAVLEETALAGSVAQAAGQRK
jgi:pimeloyl-ACP methyl ester carboxylesterase